jgi:hypothetical protein
MLYFDSDVVGFGLRISSGARSFALTYRVRGTERQRCYTIGRFPNWSTTAARQKARELKRQIDNGDDPSGAFVARKTTEALQPVLTLQERVVVKYADFVEQGITPQAFLYRHFEPGGDLLYVGITLSFEKRTIAHMRQANWRDQIFMIVIEPFATREEALAAEREVIRTEFPKFNSHHNTRRHPIQELGLAVDASKITF